MSKPVLRTQKINLNKLHKICCIARNKGATDAVAEVSEGGGLSISVRKAKVETIEQNRDKGVGITVYIGQKAWKC